MNQKKKKGGTAAELTWADIGFVVEGFSFAQKPLHKATRHVTDEYSLGPRGPWMVLLIARGGLYPLDLTNIFEVGRSLITVELNRLYEAGLIKYSKSGTDGRRIELTLTPLGEKVNRLVKADLAELVKRQLGAYTRDEILLCARMLRDLRRKGDETSAERYEQWSDEQLLELAAEPTEKARKSSVAKRTRRPSTKSRR